MGDLSYILLSQPVTYFDFKLPPKLDNKHFVALGTIETLCADLRELSASICLSATSMSAAVERQKNEVHFNLICKDITRTLDDVGLEADCSPFLQDVGLQFDALDYSGRVPNITCVTMDITHQTAKTEIH